jgi:hypothetical protein
MERQSLARQYLMDHEYAAVGPLSPLGLLMAIPERPSASNRIDQFRPHLSGQKNPKESEHATEFQSSIPAERRRRLPGNVGGGLHLCLAGASRHAAP